MKQVERDVLGILRDNARASADDIAKMVGVSAEEVTAIIRKLEDDRVILTYTVVTDDEKADPDNSAVRAIVELQIQPQRQTGFDEIARRVCMHDQVVGHYLVSGNYDFLIIVEGESLHSVSDFVSSKLATLDHVRATRTHFIMRKYKEKGVCAAHFSDHERLAVTP